MDGEGGWAVTVGAGFDVVVSLEILAVGEVVDGKTCVDIS